MELLWISRLLLGFLLILKITADPGLRRVPKVYNALITSDQNLVPSRAYPVIQPVLHRSAVNYVSPYYYGPYGPEFGPYGLDVYPPPGSRPVSPGPPPGSPPDANNPDDKKENKEATESVDKDGKDRVPVTFYPNYQSVYFNPYLYGYNLYPQAAPGTYYVNYPPGPGPLLPPPPPFGVPQPYPGVPGVNGGSPGSDGNGEEKKSEKVKMDTTEKAPEASTTSTSVPKKQNS